MPKPEYTDLRASIKATVLDATDPAATPLIWLYQGKVLDGWHRYLCCLDLDIEPVPLRYNGDDPVGWVIQQNALRRHLTASQRAAAIAACRQWAAQNAEPQQEGASPPGGRPEEGTTLADRAQQAGVSRSTQAQAERAERHGLGAHVRDGTISAKQADQIVQAGLENTVVAGTMTPQAAAEAAAEELTAAPAPKAEPEAAPEAAGEVAGAVVPVLEHELNHLRQQARELQTAREEIAFLRAETSGIDEARDATFTGQREVIRSLKASLAEQQRKYADLQAAHNGAIARLREKDA